MSWGRPDTTEDNLGTGCVRTGCCITGLLPSLVTVAVVAVRARVIGG